MKLACISGVVLLAAGVLPAPAGAGEPQETERIDRTAQIRANGQVRLKSFSGRVTITGSNRSDVSIHAVRRATRDRLDHIKLDVEETPSGVTIDANRKDDAWRDRENDVVETDFDIEVPSDVRLDVHVFSSSVDVRDVRGDEHVKTFSGTIDLTGAWGSVDAETFSGPVNLKLAGAAGGRLEFESFSGTLRSDVPLAYHGGSRRRVSGDIGSGPNDYHIKTFSGDVTIR